MLCTSESDSVCAAENVKQTQHITFSAQVFFFFFFFYIARQCLQIVFLLF